MGDTGSSGPYSAAQDTEMGKENRPKAMKAFPYPYPTDPQPSLDCCPAQYKGR